MKHICQKDYPYIEYGDGSISDNGCAVCCAAMAMGFELEEIISIWQDKHWDDEFGTLPQAFENLSEHVEKDFRMLDETAKVRFKTGDIFILLGNCCGMHYELIEVTSQGIVLHDPRQAGIVYLMPAEAEQRIKLADYCWIVQ